MLKGDKCFEVRENDRGYQKGDLVQFEPYDPYKLITHHPIKEKTYMITYVLSGWGIKNGYVAFGNQGGGGVEMAKFFMDGKVYDTEQAEKVFASRGYGFMFELPENLAIYHTKAGNWFSTKESLLGKISAQIETEEIETYERLFGEVERA